MSKMSKDLSKNASYSFSKLHRRSTSSKLKVFFRVLVKLVERAIESLGHELSSARSTSAKDILPMKL